MSFENTSRSRFPRISFISPKNKSKEHKQKKRNKKTVLRSDEIYINLHDEACSQLIFLEHTSRRDFFIALIGDFARGASKKEKKHNIYFSHLIRFSFRCFVSCVPGMIFYK